MKKVNPMGDDRQRLTQEINTRLEQLHEDNLTTFEELVRDRLHLDTNGTRFRDIVALFKMVSPDTLNSLPLSKLTLFLDRLTEFTNTISNTDKNTTHAESRKLPGQINDNKYDDYFSALIPIIHYSSSCIIAKLQKDAQDRIQAIDTLHEKAAKTLAAMRDISGKHATETQAKHFESEADDHQKSAKRWLGVALAIASLLIAVASAAALFRRSAFLSPTNAIDAIQLGITKAVIYSTFAYGVILASRNYMASRHNQAVNKHRQNSLATYPALLEASNDPVVRSIIITKAAESIFGPQPTGFTKTDTVEGSPTTPLLNFASDIVKRGGGGFGSGY